MLSSIVFMVAGCASSQPQHQGSFTLASGQDGPDKYVIDPADIIVVHAIGIKELDRHRQYVRPDGKISFSLIDELKIQGLTREKAERLVNDSASRYYVHPQITLEVIAGSKFFHVVGSGVVRPSKHVYTGRETVYSVLCELDLQGVDQVLLTRPEAPGHPVEVAVIDLKRMFSNHDFRQSYLIQPNDIIDIPRKCEDGYRFPETKLEDLHPVMRVETPSDPLDHMLWDGVTRQKTQGLTEH